GSHMQFVLTQPNSVSTNLGSTVKLSCKRSTGNIGSNYVNWYQQHEGRSPTTMIYRDDKRPDGVPDRFSGSIDRSSNSALLTINNVQTEDEADYFCHSYSSGIVFGGGTKLTVLGGSDYEFLKSWTVEDLQKRLLALDPMMEQEIEEIRQKYQCKRQPILDAIEAK
uniref:VL-SARAH(S37C) chimera,VL-SARAH(S37C) chimera n=1 Tax=Homo sapiens TaxID=9606 RepID=UPI000BDFB09D|nr:Chain B, VL-SARAH(S37C) chimera,VL-SARAH(S37C) chimera [synthetic construct]5XCV_E Chain E, VL-SARAH(S37C) chimera,VL-SARAH(S37C) chimera [synthetic construct]